MPRIVKIATTSLATLEDTAPPYNLRHPDPAATRTLALALLDGAGAGGADLAVLPETFLAAGLPGSAIKGIAEPLDGPTLTAVAAKARTHAMYVVAGAFVANPDGTIENLAVLFDREGEIVGNLFEMPSDRGRDRQRRHARTPERRLRHGFRPPRPRRLLRSQLVATLGGDGRGRRRGGGVDIGL